MKLDFLSSRKGDIPERNSEMKPYIKNTINRIKEGNFSKKEQAALAAVLILAASGTGYGAFIHAPKAQQDALKAALNATPAVAHAQEADGSAFADEKPMLKETEVEQAVANDIASDPNVEITSEEVVPDGENSGLMNLVVEHSGSTDVLSQYLETLQGVSYKLNIDSISYNKDPSDVEATSIRLSIPYDIVDNSLSSKTFDTAAPEATAPAAPDTTATPATGTGSSTAPSTAPSSSSSSTSVHVPHDDAFDISNNDAVYIPYASPEHKACGATETPSEATIGNAAEDERNRLPGAGLNDVLGLRLPIIGFHG